MITEDYVSFETAKLLKEKGFDENCTNVYNLNNRRLLMANFYSIGQFVYNSYLSKERPELITSPTLQMAMKWLREEKGIALNIGWTDVYKKEYRWWCIILNQKDGNILRDEENYSTYEEACESAIKYCLENLI